MTQRSPILAAAILLLIFIARIQATPNRAGAQLECRQHGVAVTRVAASNDFQILGTGFRPFMTASVCIQGRDCLPVEVDAAGAFIQSRRLSTPGTYGLEVYQLLNRKMESWQLRASSRMTVVG